MKTKSRKKTILLVPKCAHITSDSTELVCLLKVQSSAKRNLFIHLFIIFGTKAFTFRSEYAHITIDKALSNFGVYHIICSCHELEAPLTDQNRQSNKLYFVCQ